MDDIIDQAWDDVVGGMEWLKAVIFGEFDDNRPVSAVVAEMALTLYPPGTVIITSARDLTAVSIRLVKHPEKRGEVHEWMLIVGCAIPLALPVVGAAIGVAADGVGAIVGGIAGTELGAFLRAVSLLLLTKGGILLEELLFKLRPLLKGDIIKALRELKFVNYTKTLGKVMVRFCEKVMAICRDLRAYLLKWPAIARLDSALQKLEEFEKGFYGLQTAALAQIPKALNELDSILSRALEHVIPAHPHLATLGVPAHLPVPTTPTVRTPLPSLPNNPLAKVGQETQAGGAANKAHGSFAESKAGKPSEPPPPPHKPAEREPNVHQQTAASGPPEVATGAPIRLASGPVEPAFVKVDGGNLLVAKQDNALNFANDLDSFMRHPEVGTTPGRLDIVAHGTPNSIQVGGESMSATQFGNVLKQNNLLDGYSCVRLYSCSVGAEVPGGVNFAQQLSNEINMGVSGANRDIISQGGNFYIADDLKYLSETNEWQPVNGGRFIDFSPK